MPEFFSKKPKFLRYEDPTETMSGRALQTATWYVRHKFFLKRLLIIFLSVFSLLTCGYGFGYFLYYFGYGVYEDERQTAAIIYDYLNLPEKRALSAVAPLDVSELRVYDVAPDIYTLSVLVKNPNPRHRAFVSYSFRQENGETASASAVLEPLTIRPLPVFNARFSVFPASSVFSMDSVSWQRINPHEQADPATFISKYKKFSLERFDADLPSVDGLGIFPVGLLVKNEGEGSFYEGEFLVEFFQNGQSVALYPFNIPNFLSGQSRYVTINLSSSLGRPSEARIYAITDLFDENVLIKN